MSPRRRQTLQEAVIPAPVGGINTADVGPGMPDLDAIYAYNVVAAEHGLRGRTGYREWCTSLTGAQDNWVRSLLPFVGDAGGGADNRLFATTDTGLWDVSSSTDTPSQVQAFVSSAGDAGRGSSTVFATEGGRFLVYCDEENGLYVYTATTASWAKVTAGVTQPWEGSTTVLAGNQVVNGGNIYICTTEGVTAATGGPTGVGVGIADGSAAWNYVGAASAGVIGSSLGDQQAGLEFDPSQCVFPCVWKNRLWLVERDTSRAWYLPINSLYGTATSFDFGVKMRAGGALVGLYNWSYDGGNGLDTLLVGISAAGDVIIYAGTDPDGVDTFGLNGSWFIGGVPYGRRIATDYGGDVLVMSQQGVVSLAKLVVRSNIENQGQYATTKVANIFSRYVAQRRNLRGWEIHVHPVDNTLVLLVPGLTGGAAEPMAMSFATKGWSQYRDLPMVSGGTWNGEFYFGTADGRVCWSTDYVDAVPLDGSSSEPVKCSVLTAFRGLGNLHWKKVAMLRPTLLSGSATPVVQATPRYDYDLTEPSEPSGSPSGGWDSGTWDSATFGADLTAYRPLQGATGMGRDVAVAVRWSATSRTVLVDVGILWEPGGAL